MPKLKSITIVWRVEGKDQTAHYDASRLGEGVARQRAESRLAILRASKIQVVKFDSEYERN